MTNADPEEEIVYEVILVDPETGEPYPDDEPLILTKEDYEGVDLIAESRGETVEETIIFLVKVAIDSIREATED